LLHHALDFSTESDEASDLVINVREMATGDYIGLSAGSFGLI
jgi:hypothetical protein